MSSEATLEVARERVTPATGKGALGTRRFRDSTRIQTQSWTSCGVEIETRVQDNQADSGWMCAST